jgi:hypothetical protein
LWSLVQVFDWHSLVLTMTRLRGGRPENHGSILGTCGQVSFHLRFQSLPSFQSELVGLLARDTATETWRWTRHFHTVPKLNWGYNSIRRPRLILSCNASTCLPTQTLY